MIVSFFFFCTTRRDPTQCDFRTGALGVTVERNITSRTLEQTGIRIARSRKMAFGLLRKTIHANVSRFQELLRLLERISRLLFAYGPGHGK